MQHSSAALSVHPIDPCDDLAAPETSFTEPLSLHGDRVDVVVDHLPRGATLLTSVRAALFPESAGEVQVFSQESEARFEQPYGRLTVQLVPGALNHVSLCARGGHRGESAAVSLVIDARSPTLLIPPGFTLLLGDTVTQADLDAELKRIIEAVKKIDPELAKFLEDNVTFWEGEDSKTGKIDPAGGNTKANTRIRISRKQWREALAALKAAADEDKAALAEDLLRQFLEQILHEANHRKGIIEGNAKATVPEEEDRNTVDLIRRLIGLIEKLKNGTDPDKDKLIERLRAFIAGEKLYRWKWGITVEPWKSKYEKVKGRFKRFKDKLKQISEDGSKSADEKKTAARDAYKEFTDAAGAEKGELEQHFNVDLHLGYNPDTLEPTNDVQPTDKFDGKTIP